MTEALPLSARTLRLRGESDLVSHQHGFKRIKTGADADSDTCVSNHKRRRVPVVSCRTAETLTPSASDLDSAVPTPIPAVPPPVHVHAALTPLLSVPGAGVSPKIFAELSARSAYEPVRARGLDSPTPRHSIIASLIEDNQILSKSRSARSTPTACLRPATAQDLAFQFTPALHNPAVAAAAVAFQANAAAMPAHEQYSGLAEYYQAMAQAFMQLPEFACFAPPRALVTAGPITLRQ